MALVLPHNSEDARLLSGSPTYSFQAIEIAEVSNLTHFGWAIGAQQTDGQ